MIACGLNHCLFIDPNGVVWTSGSNDLGQLGLGHTENRNTFCPIKDIPFAVQVSASIGGNDSAILDHQGDLWAFGEFDGLNQEQIMLVPTKVPDLPHIIMVSCGFDHIIALDAFGFMWGVGDNTHNQLSIDIQMSIPDRASVFSKINAPKQMGSVVKICCGTYFSICQSETEDLWGTGENAFGEIGMRKGKIVRFTKVLVEDDCKIQSFGCGNNHTAVLDWNGGVWTTGCGRNGALGLGKMINYKYKLTKIPNIPPMKQLVCGGECTIMTDINGNVYACGNNMCCNLGIPGGNASVFFPTMVLNLSNIVSGCISRYHSLLVDEEGSLWASGDSELLSIDSTSFVKVEGKKVNTAVGQKRFRNTKRAREAAITDEEASKKRKLEM